MFELLERPYVNAVTTGWATKKRNPLRKSGYWAAIMRVMHFCITMSSSIDDEVDMSTLTVTSRGQVTFRKDVLQHLGIQPGEKIEVDLLPDGRAELRAARPAGSFHQLRGILKGKTNGASFSIEQINDVIAKAGAKAGTGKA